MQDKIGEQWLKDRLASFQRKIQKRIDAGKRVLSGGVFHYNRAIMLQMSGDELCYWVASQMQVDPSAVDVVLRLREDGDGLIVNPEVNVRLPAAALGSKLVQPQNEHEIQMMLRDHCRGVVEIGVEKFREVVEQRSGWFDGQG
jgi:hypothetical protein